MANGNGSRLSPNAGSMTVLTVLIVVAVLYFARVIFIPLALAMLLAFLLAPLVARLQHWKLGRVPSTVVVVLFSFLIIGLLGSVMASQLADLAHKLPVYQQNVHQKLQSIRVSGGGIVNRVTRTVHNITEELSPPPPPQDGGQPNQPRPSPVEVHRSAFAPLEVIQKILGSVLSVLVTAGIVIVFVIFILIQQEDLRDRLIRLVGAKRLEVTTRVLDDAANRVSRYLLAQLVVNVTYGCLAGVALYFIGVPDPLMWGIMATLLRYIPYLGIWVAATMPAAVALAVLPGWMNVPLIFGIYFGIDLLMYNLAEPILYGSSTGVSPIAVLLGAVFWTWLWGPVGLLLATPLTVCVVVLGRHVPRLEFLSVMLSDEPVLPPETRFYQRMLAMDLEEATEIAEEFLKGKSLEELYDQVVIPALSLAEEDRHRGRMDETRQQFIFRNTRILVEDLAERADELVAGNGKNRVASKGNGSLSNGSPIAAPVLCLPARDEADELAALMLAQLLTRRGLSARPMSVEALARESLEELGRAKARVACVFAVPPAGYMHARYLCRRLHDRFRGMRLIAAILTERDVEEVRNRRPALAADELASSLKQAAAEVASFVAAEAHRPG